MSLLLQLLPLLSQGLSSEEVTAVCQRAQYCSFAAKDKVHLASNIHTFVHGTLLTPLFTPSGHTLCSHRLSFCSQLVEAGQPWPYVMRLELPLLLA